MSIFLFAAAASSVLGVGAANIEAPNLNLVCLLRDPAEVLGSPPGNEAIADPAAVNRSERQNNQINIGIQHGAGQVRLPAKMIPQAHGGQNRWFRIRNLKITSSGISGSIAINFFYGLRLHIDRMSLAFNLSGRASVYQGHCSLTASK